MLFISQQKNLPFFLIAIGFLASYISSMFSSELAFVIYLLGGLKYVGVFMFIIGSRKLKFIPLILVYGSIIVSSLKGAMFHDLLTWLIFLGIIAAIKYRPSTHIKFILSCGFILFVIIIQILKKDYRVATWEKGQATGLATFSSAYEENQREGGFLMANVLEKQIVRINQGYIVTNIMKTVPNVVPFSNGEELKQILTAAILPRFMAPDKLKAGDHGIFEKYTGLGLRKGTSMGLSSIGDAYINFGVFGGCIFMFVLGLLYSEVLKAFHRYSKYYPVLLLFTPLVFYYPIRPDCELQTILGHLVKSCFLIYVVFLVWRRYFRVVDSS